MYRNIAISVDCARYSNRSACNDVKEASDGTAICENGAEGGTDRCRCASKYYDSSSPFCTKLDLSCSSLGESACSLTDGKC